MDKNFLTLHKNMKNNNPFKLKKYRFLLYIDKITLLTNQQRRMRVSYAFHIAI